MAGVSTDGAQDRRARRTRRSLQQALLELLRKEPMAKLTVSQIAARADVSRQAFYAHFGSKEELLLSHVDDVFDEIHASAMPPSGRPHSVGLADLLETTFTEWGNRADSLRIALQIEDKDQLIDRLRLHMADMIAAFRRYGREQSPPDDGYIIDFYTGGIYMLLRSWCRDGFDIPPRQMAELAYEMIIGKSSPDRRAPSRENSCRPAAAGS